MGNRIKEELNEVFECGKLAFGMIFKKDEVTPEDIFRVIPLCLRHRLRKDPLESIDSGDKVRDTFKRVFGYA